MLSVSVKNMVIEKSGSVAEGMCPRPGEKKEHTAEHLGVCLVGVSSVFSLKVQ